MSPSGDGAFEFTVTDVERGVKSLSDPYDRVKPQGQFVLVSLTVKNVGAEAQLLDSVDQQAHDAEGKTYQTDPDAELYANEADDVWLNEVNPGNQVEGVIVFDIPANPKLTTVELHDSPFSDGVTVRL